VSELGYLFLTMSSLHIIARDLDVRDRSCCKVLNDVKSCNTIKDLLLYIMLTTVKARVLNKPYIHY
jgi:hypothetical protein